MFHQQITKAVRGKISAWRSKGTIAPSSRFLVQTMLTKIDYRTDLDLLQLGFGNGVFAKHLLKMMTPKSTLTIFEIDPTCRKFTINDPRIVYLEDSAEHISAHFPTKQFDHIISTLPFASLPKHISVKIYKEIQKNLKEHGKFLQFQYSLYSKRDIEKLFHKKPKINFVVLNIPPAFIYEIEK